MRTSVWRGLAAAVAVGLVMGAAGVAMADVPGTLTHQGRLFDGGGKPITDTLTMTFNSFDSLNSNVPLVSESPDVPVEDGYSSVSLGEANPIKGILDGKVKYMGIAVGNDQEMSPRVVVQSVPYAIIAGD